MTLCRPSSCLLPFQGCLSPRSPSRATHIWYVSFLVSFGPIDNVAVNGEHHIHLLGCPSLFGRGCGVREGGRQRAIEDGTKHPCISPVAMRFPCSFGSLPGSAGKIVEVGCYLGGAMWYGAQIARDNYSKYRCVDHWRDTADLAVGEEHYRGFMENMTDAGLVDAIQVHRKPSVDAAGDFEDGSLSLVFLDGDHSCEGCLADIDAWWPKLKSDGVMLGHDYCPSSA